jgi:hypothetical protein
LHLESELQRLRNFARKGGRSQQNFKTAKNILNHNANAGHVVVCQCQIRETSIVTHTDEVTRQSCRLSDRPNGRDLTKICEPDGAWPLVLMFDRLRRRSKILNASENLEYGMVGLFIASLQIKGMSRFEIRKLGISCMIFFVSLGISAHGPFFPPERKGMVQIAQK